MTWGLYLFVASRRLRGARFLAGIGVAAALLSSAVVIAHAAAPPRYTLTVFDFDLNPATGNRLLIFDGRKEVAEASVFNGTIRPDGSAHFRLPPGEYVVYVGNAQNDIRSLPSGPLRSASFSVLLDRDRNLDIRRELSGRGPGYARGPGF